MSDIVERLRRSAMPIDADIDPDAVADELERLRDENAALRQALKAHAEEAAKLVSAEPVAWDIYLPDAQHGYITDDLDDIGVVDDLTNHENAVVTPLYRCTSPAIPEGWVMVPKEADEMMIDNGVDAHQKAWCSADRGRFNAEQQLRAAYRAMLAAAPKYGEKE